MAEFLDDARRLFSEELLKAACVLEREPFYDNEAPYFLGVDVATDGGDESTFEILKVYSDTDIRHYENEIQKGLNIPQNADRIIALDQKYKFHRIGVDDRGVGRGVYDLLLREPTTKKKARGLDNAKKAQDYEGRQKIPLLKEDMYLNLLTLLQKGYLKLLRDPEVIASLASVQKGYIVKEGRPTEFRIWGNYTHVAEGLIRAAHLVVKEKVNKLTIRYI